MTTPSKPPVTDQDFIELAKAGGPASDGNIPEPEAGSPSRKMTGKLVGEVRRLSTISEQDMDKPDTDSGGRAGSGLSVCSDRFKSSSSVFSSDDSYQPDSGDDCATLLLACLHCHFHELMVLLPDTCERAVSRCFPSIKYIPDTSEKDKQGKDGWNCNLELDCNCCSSCQDTAELLELAMEISEVCYR